MNRQEMKDYLLQLIEQSDRVSGEYILLPKKQIIRIVQMLAGPQVVRRGPKLTDGQQLFYCADCGKSFWAAGREDKDCYTQWHYHRWYADCPECKQEVAQNDRYWR